VTQRRFKTTMPVQLIILVGAIVIAWLMFTWLIKVVKASVSTAFTVAIIVLALQLAFGVNPQMIWQQVIHLPQAIQQIFTDSMSGHQ
jgi:type IV secretory pathway TrbL component